MGPAYCPRCGKEVSSLFELVPDATKTLRSIACSDCLGYAARWSEVDLAATVEADRQETRAILIENCPQCQAPRYKSWRFCTYCRHEAVRPS